MSDLDRSRVDQQPTSKTEAKPKEQAKWRGAREAASLYLAISLGSIIGSVMRALASLAALEWFGQGFPWGTLFVNVVGSFIIGFYATLTGPDGRSFSGTHQRQFVMTGICGGFTTFSAFSLESFLAVQAGKIGLAGLYVVTSVITWFAAVWLGHVMASRLNRLGGS